jgi:octaprenyl-diphosphate synthase
MVSGAPDRLAGALHRYGEALGIAFQIQDDLLDLVGEERIVGKSLGRDLDKGKITLPIIHFLRGASHAERGTALRLIAGGDAEALRQRLIGSGAVERAGRAAADLVDQAKQQLVAVPAGEPRDLLAAMADAVVARDR